MYTEHTCSGNCNAQFTYGVGCKDCPIHNCQACYITEIAGGEEPKREPKLGDQLYYDGAIFGYFAHITSVATDGRITFRTSTGLSCFSYEYKWDEQSRMWYVHFETANKERIVPKPGDDVCIEDINTYARIEVVMHGKAAAYTRAGGRFKFNINDGRFEATSKQVPCWVIRSNSCDWSN